MFVNFKMIKMKKIYLFLLALLVCYCAFGLIPVELVLSPHGVGKEAGSFALRDGGVLKQSIYIDFGKNDGSNGNITNGPDVNGNYWNNALEYTLGSKLTLVDSQDSPTGFELEITKTFRGSNGRNNGGIREPDKALLGDLAIGTATEDYFYIEGAKETGSFRIKNLNKNRAYKFYIFGSRESSEERVAYISFSGSTGSNGTYRISGPDMNQNTGSIYESDLVFPDHKGEIDFQLALRSGGFAYVNVLKIEEYAEISPWSVKNKFYIDFGRDNGNDGNITESPDANNNYWNNVAGDYSVAKGKKITLTNSAGNISSIEMELASDFRSNGKNHGGVITPDPALLNDLAIGTATEDYLFIESGSSADPGKIVFRNLNQLRKYRFHVFGSRENTESRTGLFTFTGKDSSVGIHRMGGANCGGQGVNGNNNEVFVSDLITPDQNNTITFDITRYASNFAYLNVIKIEECSDEDIIKATSVKLTGADITQSGQTSQIVAEVLPAGATYPAIIWKIDNTSIARIDNKGILYPKKNGKVTVTASIVYEENEIISDHIDINIGGQLGNIGFSGTASEDEDVVEMNMITDRNGTITNDFEIYTSLKGNGSFTFQRDLGNGTKIEYGAGATPDTLVENGKPIETTISGPVRITADLTQNKYRIQPITTLNVVGNSTSTGNDVTHGLPLSYKGAGVWSARLTLNGGDPRFNFVINKTANECLKRITGTNQVIMQSHGVKYGIPMEDIRTNMNGGEYEVTIDLRNYTYSVSCGQPDNFKISYMGSSVASGSGAQNNLGWAYMYTNLLKERFEKGLGLDWKTSNISIGGNTTANLLDRWERDLLSNCSSYVIYALSLGNEGIHEKGEPAYNSYHDGMLKAIEQAREVGIKPIMANNYTRADFNASDYAYVKKLNLLIHEWDLPSINTLGAIDDGAGHWANGYENDNAHPNTAGHEEFLYALVPSLFDALEAGKSLPQKVDAGSYKLGRKVSTDRIELKPEHIVHPFTISFEINTNGKGIIASFENVTGTGKLEINELGVLSYKSPVKGEVISATKANDAKWHRVTLTHYYAWGITKLYVDNEEAGYIYEKLVPEKFVLGSNNSPDEIELRQLFFWRAGMNSDEIKYVNDGKMMKSSLEIYAPLGGSNPLVNLAQSTNILTLSNSDLVFDQNIYVDFGKDNGEDGNITTSPDKNGNHWNNAVKTTSGTKYDLIDSYGIPTSYEMTLTSNFLSNGIRNGGLLKPDSLLLGDFAVNTATQDYFFIEENNGAVTGGIDFKGLDPGKVYRFHIFGSRQDKNERTGMLNFTGTNFYQGTHQMGGENIAQGNVTGDVKNQNNSTIFVSEGIYPDTNGTIHFELARHAGKFAHINAMKIEQYSLESQPGASPLISVTPNDGSSVRIARIHSSTGGFNNEGPENLLLDKDIPANKNKKWCFNAKEHSVIIELSDYYDVNKFIIDDCRTRENNPNVPEYYIYVSTTGTADGDWKEVAHEINQSDVMYKVKEIDPVKARYIKFVPKGIDVIRIYKFGIYGRKSFESAHPEGLVSVGKPVISLLNSPDIHRGANTLFDGDITAANSKWSASGGSSQVVVDLYDNYAISQFVLYDAQSVNKSEQNIDGYKISVSSDLSDWDLLVDASGRVGDDIKKDTIIPAKAARYVMLDIPEERMNSEKNMNLYEFGIYGKLVAEPGETGLNNLMVSVGELSPVFNAERTTYAVNVAKEVETINIQALAKNENAVISGDLGERTLKYGDNNFFVKVVSADEIASKTYRIKVNRAEKSEIAGLKSLSIKNLDLLPEFSPSTRSYRTEVSGKSVEITAEATSSYAKISGVGDLNLEDGANYITVSVTSEDGINTESYDITVYNTENLISVSSPDGKGKRIVNIDSYSSMTHAGENPFRILRGWKENLSGNNTMKWCDTSGNSWVIFSLADIYTINHIEFRDCKMVEPSWANVPQYSVYVSTTDTLDGDWTEIVNEQGVSTINEKIKSFDPVDARFVKFVPANGDNAIRIYGFDIYGKFKNTIDRGDVISTGKSIVNYSACTNDMLTPANILDGRFGTVWEFAQANAFVEIDLEKDQEIGKFVVVDSLNRINGYKVFISSTGNGSDWKEVASPTFESSAKSRKEAVLEKPETARYVRLEVPQSGTNRIAEFEVYRYNATGINEVEEFSREELIIYPNPVTRGEKVRLDGTGILRIYSLQGILVHQQEVKGLSFIPTDNLTSGYYIIQLTNESVTKQAKLIVR